MCLAHHDGSVAATVVWDRPKWALGQEIQRRVAIIFIAYLISDCGRCRGILVQPRGQRWTAPDTLLAKAGQGRTFAEFARLLHNV